MQPYWQQQFANPSSPHHLGIEAENTLTKCRHFLAHRLNVKPSELFFTSGGTEANNLAILGFTLNQHQPGHIITTSIEHASVLNPIDHLASCYGWKVSKLNVDKYGYINLSELTSLIRPETRLISIMQVNNELGTVQDLAGISRVISENNSDRKAKIIFHVDACQALGKTKVTINPYTIDLASFSGHKIYGPKGTGLLYAKEQIKLRPILFGGGQENNIRSGTENVPGIVGFTKACSLAFDNLIEKNCTIVKHRDRLVRHLSKIPGSRLNSPPDAAPHIINMSFTGIKAEVLIHFLEQKGVFISMGAACSSHKASVSHVLRAIGLSQDEAAQTVRISLSPMLTDAQIDYATQAIADSIKEVRDIYNSN